MADDAQKIRAETHSQSKLSTKLLFSHLLVALGSLLILMLVIGFAIQRYFINSQHRLIYAQSLYASLYYEKVYLRIGGSWDNLDPTVAQGDEPSLQVVTDQSGHIKLQYVPLYLSLDADEETTIQQSIARVLSSGQTVEGDFQGDDPRIFSGYYVCQPLVVRNQVIGALFFAAPARYPQGFVPDSFLSDVFSAMLFSGGIIALIVASSSLFFVRRLTRPLVLMKQAVDKLSAGNYAERVPDPLPVDELGQLARSFNHMARQIEEDIEALQRQEQYRREITANVAHDLATPLASIRGFSEALADGVLQDEQARADAYAVMIRECERLSLLIQDMQQLSSLESGRVALENGRVDLGTLVKETVEVIARQYDEASLVIENQVEQNGELSILADSNRIIQVLLNLFDNARHHTPPGGTITIEGALRNGRVLLWIKDTGEGIAPTELPHIFDRFYRADPARTHGRGGSGLGLSIVKTIVELHRGNIQAESVQGQGTTILLAFPCAQ